METKNNATVWIILAAVVALTFGCVGGALFGGVAGFAMGRESARPSLPQDDYRITPDGRAPIIPIPPATPDAPTVMGGALVIQVAAESPAEQAGIEAGDLIIALNGVSLRFERLAELLADYEPGDVVMLTIVRGERELERELVLGRHPERPGMPWIGIHYEWIEYYYRDLPGGWFGLPTP